MSLSVIEFESFEVSVPQALEEAGLSQCVGSHERVLVKPNLINDAPPPITTPVACVEAVVRYLQAHSDATIVVGEGCGSSRLETPQVFAALGYDAMAERLGVELVDLNEAPLRRLENAACDVFPEMYLPEIALDSFLVSVPVLKAHSLADITGTLKNMIGLAPPKYYSGRFGSWKKAVFHGRMQESISDLVRYRSPDFTLMDASVGMAEFHLGGPECDPPISKLLAAADGVAVDRFAADLLGLDWRTIGHLG